MDHQEWGRAIPKGHKPIEFHSVVFRDEGNDANGLTPENPAFAAKHCDRAANDGIYTAFIPLIGIEHETEFRMFVQADTNVGKARFMGIDDPQRGDEKVTSDDRNRQLSDPASGRVFQKSTEEAEDRAMRFQRATIVHFRAPLKSDWPDPKRPRYLQRRGLGSTPRGSHRCGVDDDFGLSGTCEGA